MIDWNDLQTEKITRVFLAGRYWEIPFAHSYQKLLIHASKLKNRIYFMLVTYRDGCSLFEQYICYSRMCDTENIQLRMLQSAEIPEEVLLAIIDNF